MLQVTAKLHNRLFGGADVAVRSPPWFGVSKRCARVSGGPARLPSEQEAKRAEVERNPIGVDAQKIVP
jgi:hypothetical protein